MILSDNDEQTHDITHLDDDFHSVDVNERDACALICSVRKGGTATHGNVKRTIESLARMGHRSGFIDSEGDGVGVLTDIPRELWAKRLARAGLRSSLATNRTFWVAHVMIPAYDRNRASHLVEQICRQITDAGLHVLIDRAGKINSQVLGPNAEKNEPVFWQIAGMNGQVPAEKLDATLFDLQVRLEHDLGIHFPSFSAHSVVYKVQGTVEILRRYYPELRDPDYASTVTMGHARYSTNTNPIFERAQPFGLLGHNGEFNTISRFRLEAAMLGINLDPDNSDSQDIDRALQALCMYYDLDLIEAMEYVFPPYEHDLIQNIPDLSQMYREIRRTFGPFAQGPAAVTARLGDMCVFSVDALGLRPLWFGETEKEYFVSSERGVYFLDMMSATPKPMAPGEKIALRIRPGHSIEMMDYPAIQRHVYGRYRDRIPKHIDLPGSIWSLEDVPLSHSRPQPSGNSNSRTSPALSPAYVAVAETTSSNPLMEVAAAAIKEPLPWDVHAISVNTKTMAALGWERYHTSLIDTMALNGKEQVGSLGWDGPLAALSKTRVNLADFFKETVAVVTNPAIDMQREQAQFSTRSIVGIRPMIGQATLDDDLLVELETPLLLGGYADLGSLENMRAVASQNGTMTIEDLLDVFDERACILSSSAGRDESIEAALERLQERAIEAVLDGAVCIVLDDADVFDGERLLIDPLLITAALDRVLRHADYSQNLRRQVGIIVRSGALRDLHDMMLCVSLGADAILPYAYYAVALGIAPRSPKELPESAEVIERLSNTIKALNDGFKKVTSTIGCHELRGYGHSFSSIGLSKSVAAVLETPNYFGSNARGLTWADLTTDAKERAAELRGEKKNRLVNPDRFYPKMWKKVEDVAHGEMSLEEFTDVLMKLESKQPVAIRHILGLKESDQPIDPAQVDISIKDHDLPVLISAMSFGSQGELAYKSICGSGLPTQHHLCEWRGWRVAGHYGEIPAQSWSTGCVWAVWCQH